MPAWKAIAVCLVATGMLQAEWLRIRVVNQSTSAWLLRAPLGLTWTAAGNRLWEPELDETGHLGTLRAGGEVTFTVAEEETGGYLEVRRGGSHSSPLDPPAWQRLPVKGPFQTFYFLDDAASRGGRPVIAAPVQGPAGGAQAEPAASPAAARPVLGGPGSAFHAPAAPGQAARPPGGPGSAFRAVESEKKKSMGEGVPG